MLLWPSHLLFVFQMMYVFDVSLPYPVYDSPLSHTCHMLRPSHSSWFVPPNNTWSVVQFLKLHLRSKSFSSLLSSPCSYSKSSSATHPRHCQLSLTQVLHVATIDTGATVFPDQSTHFVVAQCHYKLPNGDEVLQLQGQCVCPVGPDHSRGRTYSVCNYWLLLWLWPVYLNGFFWVSRLL